MTREEIYDDLPEVIRVVNGGLSLDFIDARKPAPDEVLDEQTIADLEKTAKELVVE